MGEPGGVLRHPVAGEGRLWKVWWLGGGVVILAVTALAFGAEAVRDDGRHGWGDFLDVVKLLVYAAWFSSLWRSARHTSNPVARSAVRLAVAVGIVTAGLTV